MSRTLYIQIFSMTDHAKGFDRFRGPYQGLNSELHTSEMDKGVLSISTHTQTRSGLMDPDRFRNVEAILCYRHTDTGELNGTSEMLIPIQGLPWTDLPGLELKSISRDEALIKIWNHEMKLAVNKATSIRFMKTLAYLKNYGFADRIQCTEGNLDRGPLHLHTLTMDEELTIAPPTASGFQVKMGQEIEK